MKDELQTSAQKPGAGSEDLRRRSSTDLKRATELLAYRERQQAVIASLGVAALEIEETLELMSRVVGEVRQTLDAASCEILELGVDARRLVVRAASGISVSGNRDSLATLDSLAGHAIAADRPVIVHDFARENRFAGRPLLEQGITSGLACVIHHRNGTYGAIAVHTQEKRSFTEDDANFLQSVANVVGSVVVRHEARRKLSLEREVALALSVTNGFDAAASRICVALARELGVRVIELWIPTEDGKALVRSEASDPGDPDEPCDPDDLGDQDGRDFARVLDADRFLPGEGLVGRVFEEQRVEWITDLGDAGLACTEAAHQLHLKSGFAFPIRCDNECLGVFACFASHHMLPVESLAETLDGIGWSIGNFLRRSGVESALRENERRLRLAIAANGAGVYEHEVPLKESVFRSDRWLEILGYADEDIPSGPPFADWITAKLLHPDDREPVVSAYISFLRGDTENFAAEARLRHKQGHWVWVRGVADAVERADDGRVMRVTGLLVDITDSKHIEAEARARAHALEQVNRIGMTLSARLEVDDIVERVTAVCAELTGAHYGAFLYRLGDREEGRLRTFRLAGTPEDVFADITVPRHITRIDDNGKSSLRSCLAIPVTSRSGRIQGALLLGHPRPCSFTAEHELLVGGLAGQAAVAIDNAWLIDELKRELAERRRYEEALEEAGKRKDEFFAMLGHELRNPLAAVQSSAELLARTELKDDRLLRVRDVLGRQSAHMAKLLDGLLDASRIARGKVTLSRKIVNLNRVLEALIADHQSHKKVQALKLVARLADGPIWVDGDETRLVQIFDNLLGNAMKFTNPPGQVAVEVMHVDAKEVAVRVMDTGVGIDRDTLQHVFEPFRQSAQTIDRSSGGLGLGLALAKGLVELHQGTISIDSEVGSGTEVVVRLPTSRPPKPEARRPSLSATRLRFLVIDDNRDSAEVLEDLLVTSGHQVTTALDGKSGLQAARSFLPDVVLCDLGLPDGMDGFQVARDMRKDETLSKVCLIAVTGYGRMEDKRRALASGFDEHLTKPVTLQALAAAVQRVRR